MKTSSRAVRKERTKRRRERKNQDRKGKATGGSLRLAYLQDTVTSILVADYFSLPKIGALIPADLVLWLRESTLRWMLLAAAGEQLWVKAYLKIRFHSQRGRGDEGEGKREKTFSTCITRCVCEVDW
ncbi:hypothetical protein ILYODFUR_011615 [Ilyodon furcidens]|uniref:Uncharacterized protein n=1 Tax=Ilyodon furcidens TaxID=33524 RepID=A0ABV0V2A0_9TELE